MAIATRNQQHVPLFGQPPDASVLVPVAQAVEFEGVAELAVDGEEVVDQELVPGGADAVEVPEGVVEDDEDVGQGVEFGEHVA